MRLLVDGRWSGMHGIGRFAKEIISRLPDYVSMPGRFSPVNPLDPLWTSYQIRRLAPDVYFSPGFNAPLASPSPFVFTIHDLIHLHMQGEAGFARRKYYEWIVRPAIRKARSVLTVSEFSRREIIEWSQVHPEKIKVAYPGVGSGFVPNGPRHQEDRPYLLYVGNRKPHKNIARIVRAFRQSGVSPEVLLLFSGERDPSVVQTIREAGGEGSDIRFFGNVPDYQMTRYYRGAMALLMPSLYEGFGLPALEAMACATPVICGNCASQPEVVGEAALLVDPTDVDQIAEAIAKLTEAEELRAKLSVEGLKRARLFNWDKTANIVRKALAVPGSVGL